MSYPSAGAKKIAPIDVALIWGPTDTLANGNYVTPSDSALPTQGSQKVMVPFRAWNLTDNARMDMVVVESRADKRWNPERRSCFSLHHNIELPPTTHMEKSVRRLRGAVIMPAPGDTNIILTTRPIQQGEKYTFTTSRALILDVPAEPGVPLAFALSQNFPNPFNPTTTIRYSIPSAGSVTLKVYNIVGQQVATLLDEVQGAGLHRVRFDGRRLASGVYFSRLEWGGRVAVQKMVLLK